jgi:transposase
MRLLLWIVFRQDRAVHATCCAFIPAGRSTFYRAIYKQHNVVERMFCRFKDWRRVATRFDCNIKNVVSVVTIAAAVIWL